MKPEQCITLLILLAIFAVFQGHATSSSDGRTETNANEKESTVEESELNDGNEFEAENDHDDDYEQKVISEDAGWGWGRRRRRRRRRKLGFLVAWARRRRGSNGGYRRRISRTTDYSRRRGSK